VGRGAPPARVAQPVQSSQNYGAPPARFARQSHSGPPPASPVRACSPPPPSELRSKQMDTMASAPRSSRDDVKLCKKKSKSVPKSKPAPAPQKSFARALSSSPPAGPPLPGGSAGPPPPSFSSFSSSISSSSPPPPPASSGDDYFKLNTNNNNNNNFADFESMISNSEQKQNSSLDLSSIQLMESEDEEKGEVESAGPPPAELKAIMMKQKVSGAWLLADVASLLGKLDAGKIKGGLPKLESSASQDVETLWTTAVVAAYLAKVFPRDKSNWQQVVNKAHRFIAKQKKSLGIKPDLDWKQEAEKFVNANC